MNKEKRKISPVELATKQVEQVFAAFKRDIQQSYLNGKEDERIEWHAKIRSLIPKIHGGGNARRLLESLLSNDAEI